MGIEETEYTYDAEAELPAKTSPSFVRRLIAGWTSAALVLTFLWVLFVINQTHNMVFAFQQRDLQMIWWLLLICTAGIFLIAWPVETWWIKPTTSTPRAVGIYAIVILVLGVILAAFLNTTDTPESIRYYGHMGLIIAVAVTVVTMAVVCLSRAIYPILLRHRRLTGVILAAISLIALLVA